MSETIVVVSNGPARRVLGGFYDEEQAKRLINYANYNNPNCGQHQIFSGTLYTNNIDVGRVVVVISDDTGNPIDIRGFPDHSTAHNWINSPLHTLNPERCFVNMVLPYPLYNEFGMTVTTYLS